MAATLSVATAVSLAGCAGGQDERPPVEMNQAQWSMPLDEFNVFSPELSNYAEQLLIADCLAADGYQWPVPWRDTTFPYPPGFNSVGYRLFNEDTAAKWGYHFAPTLNEVELEKWQEFVSFSNSYAPDSSFDLIFQGCSDGARDERTIEAADGFNYVSGLASQANDIARQSERVQTALVTWRECLSGRVTFALPAEPWPQMPPSEVAARFGLEGPTATPLATSEEIASAVADAECRTNSGLSAALYEEEWNEQLELVSQNRDQLERIRVAANSLNDSLLTVVADNAPAAP